MTSPGDMRCEESAENNNAQDGLPPSVDAHLSFNAGYLTSCDSFSTSDTHGVVTHLHSPDVSKWVESKNPEIRVFYRITYDQPIINLLYKTSVDEPTTEGADIDNPLDRMRLYYRELGATSSGGSVMDSSVSTKQDLSENEGHSGIRANLTDLVYDEAFEEMLINRIQNRIREMGVVGGLELTDETGLTPAGRQVKQRFGFLMQDISDDETEHENQSTKPAPGEERRSRRRRRPTPDWMLIDVPSDDTLRTEPRGPPSSVSLELGEPAPPRYARSADSESDVSVLRAIRAEGGDQFVEAVLRRLHQNLRAGHNFREYRQLPATNVPSARPPAHGASSSSDDSEAASSRSSMGRVQFKERVLVRPLGRDPLVTECRRPYSSGSGQKITSLRDYRPEPDHPDYEDSLKDRTEPAAGRLPARKAPLAAAPGAPARKPQPSWKKLLCCISGDQEADVGGTREASAACRPPPAAPQAAEQPAAAVAHEPAQRRRRRQVKTLPVRPLDGDITDEELRSLHLLFDDRAELCGLAELADAATLSEPVPLSEPEAEAEPCFADFLRACGLADGRVTQYIDFHRSCRGEADSGHGDWSTAGRPASASSADDPAWWDRRARQRRHQLRRRRRQHREYQRQLETQRDLEVEGQLRRALETQRELLREREVEREIERTRESSKERKELRLEEEVLEKELLRRLLAELQTEQERAREREKRRTVARILEEELIARLTQALARQREKSEERRGLHDTQRIEEEATSHELNNRIEELRMRIEENKLLRDNERDEEQQRLKLLEELLIKERKRMEVLETSRLEEQDQEAKTRTILTELEEKSGEDEAKSQKDYEYCAKTLLKKNALHKTMRQKLTTEIRKRELIKRKLVSLSDIEKSNPRLFQLAKVMEEVTDEKGCLKLEYNEPSTGILKKDPQVEDRADVVKTEAGDKEPIKTEVHEQLNVERSAEDSMRPKSETERTTHIERHSADNLAEEPEDQPAKTEDAARPMIDILKTELHVAEPGGSSTTDDTGGETDLELPPRAGPVSHSEEAMRGPVLQSEAAANWRPSEELRGADSPTPPAGPAEAETAAFLEEAHQSYRAKPSQLPSETASAHEVAPDRDARRAAPVQRESVARVAGSDQPADGHSERQQPGTSAPSAAIEPPAAARHEPPWAERSTQGAGSPQAASGAGSPQAASEGAGSPQAASEGAGFPQAASGAGSPQAASEAGSPQAASEGAGFPQAASGAGSPQAAPEGAGFPQAASEGAGFPQAASGAGFPQAASEGAGSPQAAPEGAGFSQAASGAGSPQAASEGAGFPQAASGAGSPQAAPEGAGFPQAASEGAGFPQAASGAGFPQAASEGAGSPQAAPEGAGFPQAASGAGSPQIASQGGQGQPAGRAPVTGEQITKEADTAEGGAT
ncbi:uncharacterized protein LOC122385387 isoform X2 [Amphibalanus amphitrite]|uniref:uncharacterized protein LOC122385387 isoform X2 n=1 Tax=Amphibalanus amphitrite TaxID=1232801 RepID=UPI001C92A502|nr:uncharacterized protein LOC122385387 isoform X2 [Amphibalanus amphitrite]